MPTTPMRLAFAVLLPCILAMGAPALASDDDGFKPLFDGKSIESWVQRGGKAKYAVEDGAIVGTSIDKTPNTFLCTPKNYKDFELRLELKVDSPLNSGVQIRSNCYDKKRTESGVLASGKKWKRTIDPGRVHGYQVEIDPSKRAWSGGIYDEGRRGWLNPLDKDSHKAARAAFKPDEWNTYRIRCQGDHIQTWVNGVPCADLKDDHTSTGFIALQVHGVGRDKKKIGKQVRWRKIVIKEL